MELVSLIDDESNKLTLLSTRLLQTAKLEAEEMSVAKDEIVIEDLVTAALSAQSKRMAGHPLEVAVQDHNFPIRGDRDLIYMALVQYLDNAAKYIRRNHGEGGCVGKPF